MNYYFFLDESGDHGLSKIDPGFPVFVLAGVLFQSENYMALGKEIIALKESIWPGKKVILHSSDIRKCEKEFVVFFNQEKKAAFYNRLNNIIKSHHFTIISTAVHKYDYNKSMAK